MGSNSGSSPELFSCDSSFPEGRKSTSLVTQVEYDVARDNADSAIDIDEGSDMFKNK